MPGKNYSLIAEQVVEKVGGKENISHSLHCATRLRFNLIDYSAADIDAVKKINGVLGAQKVGEQLQVIIGPDVDKVFDEVLKITGGSAEVVNENLDAPKQKKDWKSIGGAILDALSGCLGPAIPAIVASAFFKGFLALLGPDILGVISADSNLYTLLTFVGDAGFYFFPVIIGYTAAKKFNVTPVLGILLGGIMLHPTFTQMAADSVTDFTVFGIPCNVQNYGSTVLPIILSIWVMSYVEKFFNSKLPSSLRGVFAPAFTICVMLPITLCVLGPAGAYLGNYITTGLMAFGRATGFIGLAVISALYPLLVMTGMHMVLITALFQVFATVGSDGAIAPALTISAFAIMGVGIGASLRLKNQEQKGQAAEFAITAILAGTSEPTLYGICMRYKKPFIGLLGGGFIGGLYCGITSAISATLVPATNFTSILCFTGASTANIVNGSISCLIALVSSALLVYFFGFDKDEQGLMK
ncbi:PTS transporter subunit EIIC [Anaerolactibacter massiliensis]|uniref:PTS transporter subunit EIIC n=1 Tax=Anaerolactibacter massiliensis TaxID=2044573 RepID=UPI000CF8D6AC|nr:PTS transporter subunit EIIC [Anaerolactibacter massiliensis]